MKNHQNLLPLHSNKSFFLICEAMNFQLFTKVTEPVEVHFQLNYQERQDELGLNWDSFKYRNYDYAIGRFMSVDPLAEKYPYNSTYAFQENKMGLGRELEGLELVIRDENTGAISKGPYDMNNNNITEVQINKEGWSEELPAVEVTAHNNQDNVTQVDQVNSSQKSHDLPVNLNLSAELFNSKEISIFNSGYGDKITLNYSAGITYGHHNNISLTSTNFGYNKKGLKYAGVLVGGEQFYTTCDIDLQNNGINSTLSLFGVSLSNSLTANNGVSTSLGFNKDNKYFQYGISFKPGKGVQFIAAAILFKKGIFTKTSSLPKFEKMIN